jgi:hypothetical protein
MTQPRNFMKHPVRKILVFGTIFVVILAIAGGLAWQHFSQRRTLPFALIGEPVVGRRIYSMGSSATMPRKDAPLLHDYPVIGDPVSVSPDLAAELHGVLSSPSTYTFSDNQCFEPGMAVSFGDGAHRVDVLICLLCNRAVFFSGDNRVGRCISDEGNKRLSSIYTRLFGLPPEQL